MHCTDVVAFRAGKLEGPWSQPFFVSPAYTRTFSTQSGFSWRIQGTKKTTYLYMADQVCFSPCLIGCDSLALIKLTNPVVGHELALGESQCMAPY